MKKQSNTLFLAQSAMIAAIAKVSCKQDFGSLLA